MLLHCFIYCLLLPSIYANITLIHPTQFPINTTQPPPQIQSSKAFYLFERSSPDSVGRYVNVAYARLTYPCTLSLPSIPQPALLLVDYSTIPTAFCQSMNHVLDAADTLGLPETTCIGFYGTDPCMYETAGPYARVWYTNEQSPNRVQGLGIDPAFIAAFNQQLAQNMTSAQAYLQPTPGIFNNLVGDIGFSAIKVLIHLCMVVSVLYGSAYFWWPLLIILRVRFVKGAKYPKGYKSPLDRRFWQPYTSMIIRISSLYCLLSWLFNWRYRQLPPLGHAIYYSSLYVTIVSFGLMISRWCAVAQHVKANKVYTVLRYWLYFELAIGFVAIGTSVLSPFIDHGDSYNYFRLVVNEYVLQPTLALYALTFCIATLMFLRQVKKLSLQKHALRALHKITFLGIAGYFAALFYFVNPVLDKSRVGLDKSRYLAFLLSEQFLWILCHTLFFYFLTVPVPKQASIHVSTRSVGPQSGYVTVLEDVQHMVDWKQVATAECGYAQPWTATELVSTSETSTVGTPSSQKTFLH